MVARLVRCPVECKPWLEATLGRGVIILHHRIGPLRRLLRGTTLLSVLVVLLAFAPSASASFHFVTKWGTEGSGDGQFNTPLGVATDSSGNVYVADTSNHRIQKFDSSGTFLTKWGSSGSGDGQFSVPRGVATDSSGNVYVPTSATTGSRSSTPRAPSSPSGGAPAPGTGSSTAPPASPPTPRATSTSSTTTTTGSRSSTPRAPSSPSGGPTAPGTGSSTTMSASPPTPSGNVYVTDYFNGRIQKFDSSGTFLAQVGSRARCVPYLASPPTPRAASTSPTTGTAGSGSSTPRAPSSPKWGAPAPGTASSTPLRRRHRLRGQRLRRRLRQQPDPEVPPGDADRDQLWPLRPDEQHVAFIHLLIHRARGELRVSPRLEPGGRLPAL